LNKPAVSKAQMRRTIETLEAMGKSVQEVELRPDGTWRLRLTPAEGGAQPSSNPDDEFAAWTAQHGYS
jgi:hypothetical protein